MWRGRQFDDDGVAGRDRAVAQDDGHDARLADQVALGVAVEHGREQAGAKGLDLGAGVAEAGHGDDGLGPEVQPRVARQTQECEAARGDVLAEVAGCEAEAGGEQFVVQFHGEKVHLPQVRLRGIDGDARAMFHGRAGVGVAVDAVSGHEANAIDDRLAERVRGTPANGDDDSAGVHGGVRVGVETSAAQSAA